MRFIIAGAGFMGCNHARIIAANPKAELVGVIDPNKQRREALGGLYGVDAFDALDAAPAADAAIIAVPTSQHHALAMRALEKGLHILIEKPIASSPIEGREILNTAKSKNLTVGVGHVERHNPAYQQARAITNKPVCVNVQRFSPHPQRINDGAILDMMIHDVDLVLDLMGHSTVDDVICRSVTAMSDTEDAATAVLTFANGAIATIMVSRLAQGKTRSMEIVETGRTISVDLLRQNVSVYSQGKTELANGLQQAGLLEIPYAPIRGGEPLCIQLEDYIDAIQNKRQPLVTGEQALYAVNLCKWLERGCFV